jgi:outer membrane protein, multidrug efflux system
MLRFVCSLFVVPALVATAGVAQAGDPPGEPTTSLQPLSEMGADEPRPTIRPHQYTLAECLALSDRNFPNLWANRARLAYAHAQLDEAIWTPWFQWSAQSSFGVAPPLQGTVIYPQSATGAATYSSQNISGTNNLEPFLHFGISGVVPLYTFGKIDTARDAAEANVRVSEWDMEKARQSVRMDVRRAYYGLELTRDARVVVDDAMDRLDKAIGGLNDKIAKGDPSVGDVDRLRLEAFRQEFAAQALQVPKEETYALAALRFMTGVQTGFDVPDEPLKAPDQPLASVAQYLEAARVLRPDVNMARAGVVAREALLAYNHAKLFPDLGLGLGADFIATPNAPSQNNVYANDPFNHFYYYFAFGLRWSLDLLPQAARAREAESQLEETRSLERLALGNAMLEVEKAYAEAVEAKGREEAWAKAEHIAKQWISTVQDSIDVGSGDERTLLDPLRVYGNARIQHLHALMDYNVTMSSLALASGWDAAAPSGQ